VLYQQRANPSRADLAEWCRQLAALGFVHVRTSAVAGGTASALTAGGFTVMQELVLLEHTDVRRAAAALTVAAAIAPTTRLLAASRRAASRIDEAAFGREWALDDVALHDVCAATPRHRARAAGNPLAGYAITGRDGRQGFLQRLAVHPDAQRNGLGLALVADSLTWMARWRVERALVNTPAGNEGALALYERAGYRRLPEALCVYERSLT
jgi:ribosomal protein S18 acetylase RimI-like enzyme